MKKIVIQFLIAVVAILPSTLSAQTVVDNLYNKYSGKEGFTSINISPDMFEMLAGMNMNDSSKDAKKAQDAMKQLKSLKMLVYEPKDSTKTVDFYQEIKNKLPKGMFKHLMTVDSEDGKIRFLAQQGKDGKVKEFLMFVSGHGESVFMSLTGSIDMSTISEIGNAVNIPEMKNLKKMHDVHEK